MWCVGLAAGHLITTGLVDMIGDIVPVVGRFAQSVPPAPTRYDMAPSPPDKLIDIFDIVRMTGVFGQSC